MTLCVRHVVHNDFESNFSTTFSGFCASPAEWVYLSYTGQSTAVTADK